jgi:hypothetical protein
MVSRSRYVPALILMIAPGEAALIAAWIVVKHGNDPSHLGSAWLTYKTVGCCDCADCGRSVKPIKNIKTRRSSLTAASCCISEEKISKTADLKCGAIYISKLICQTAIEDAKSS